MSYLQQHLNTIKAEAAEKARLACANAALIELAGDILARINAAGERDVVYPSYHLIDPAETEKYDIHSRVTLQKKHHLDNDELIDALEIAGFPVCHLPVRIERNTFTGQREVFLMLAPRIEMLMLPPVPRIAAAQEVAEAA